MTRQEYNDYRSIAAYPRRGFSLSYGTVLRVHVNRSVEYKEKLHNLFTSWGFHPASVCIDRPFCDEETIQYIFGMTWKDAAGHDRSWKELYTREEKEEFDRALHC